MSSYLYGLFCFRILPLIFNTNQCLQSNVGGSAATIFPESASFGTTSMGNTEYSADHEHRGKQKFIYSMKFQKLLF